jgi:hypothetical protein
MEEINRFVVLAHSGRFTVGRVKGGHVMISDSLVDFTTARKLARQLRALLKGVEHSTACSTRRNPVMLNPRRSWAVIWLPLMRKLLSEPPSPFFMTLWLVVESAGPD